MNAAVQRFDFSPGTLIAFDGYELVVSGTIEAGLVVRDRFVGEGEQPRNWVLDDAFVSKLLLRQDVLIDAAENFDGPDPSKTNKIIVQFEDRSAEDRREAYQREAWCLAAKSVLKVGPYTEQRITLGYDQIKAAAYDRQRIGEIGTVGRNGKFTARIWGPKSVSKFCARYFATCSPHPRALLRQPPSGNTNRRLSCAQDALLNDCCQRYLEPDQKAGSSIVKLVERRFRETHKERQAAGNFSSFPTPHENTIYRRLARFSRLELTVGREGYREAQKKFAPTHHGVRALKPGELIEIDFWKGDVFTFGKRAEFWDLLTPDLQKILKHGPQKGKRAVRQRLWICIAIDVATRMPLGLGIAKNPNPRTVIDVLDQIMRDKSDFSSLAKCKMPWSQHCGLGTVVYDTGPEFFDEEVQTAILASGGSFIFGRAAVPMDKPFIERFFGSLRTEFADELPGKTGFSPQCLVAYDKQGMAAFNTEEFRLLLLRHLVDYYPLREHAGLKGQRPIDAWKEAQKYGVVRPPLPRDRRNATGLKLTRVLSKEGIHICGIPFNDASLFPNAIRNGKTHVNVRLDPNDLREITILLDDKRVHLANQRPDLAHHSIRTLMAAIKKMTAAKPKDRIFYEYVLAEHADWFAHKIKVGIQARGLPSNEMTAEEIDWFEKSFCLKLQITKTPRPTLSADMETLLSGGQGPGIFGAHEIAAEKATAALDTGAGDHAEAMALSDPVSNTSTPAACSGVETSWKSSSAAPRDQPDVAASDVSSRRTEGSAPGRFTGEPKGKGSFT
ncbi:DDE-type integrase/transposase/recombinase [Rhodobacter capsulatus]|uniref:DDE-type integrase/transposase/recombinase n=1 Tax=Rhodobacter capsulatus TaxID=1061 RepID=UPI0004103FA1|nr:DDE-type integrase/transposase/recombinase [Rhodobacter capsulatus]